MNTNKLIPIISTEKLEETAGFYVAHLGFEISFEADTYIGLKNAASPSLELAFMTPAPDSGARTQGCTLCLEVDSADKGLSRAASEVDGVASRRTVRPVCLAFIVPHWMLSGWCELRKAFRNFRLDRMTSLKMLDDTFEDEPGRTLKSFLEHVRGED